jgi:3-oxoadipate enol-lactonase
MARVEANGININCVVDGPEGAPWVTFITGITNDAAMWDDHVPALSENFRLLRLDSRGHGGTDATPPPYSFDQLTDDVAGVWDALGVERSHVVGIGLGGMTTLALALRFPRRVSAIVPTACRAELVPEYEGIWPPMLEKSAAEGIEGIVDITASRWFPEAFREANPAKMEDVRAMIRRSTLDGYHGCIGALLSLDFGDRLAEIHMPALFVSGALDAIGGPPDVMQLLAQSVQDGQHVSLPGAGHICNIANPAAYDDALLSFFESF